MGKTNLSETKEMRFTCGYCGKNFKKLGEFKKHTNVHTKYKSHSRDDCEDNFGDVKKSKIHHTHETSFDPETCFEKKSNQERNRHVHVGKKPFSTSRNALNRRLQRNATEKPNSNDKSNKYVSIFKKSQEKVFSCDVCKKEFLQKRNLSNHYEVHIKKKPFHCDACDIGFSQRSSLNRHKSLHSKEKPHNCGKCDKTFARKDSLALHVLRMHTESKSYACDLCRRSFTSCSRFRRHLYVHIPESDACKILSGGMKKEKQ